MHAILQMCSRCLLCAGDKGQEDLGSGLACLLDFLGSQATHTKGNSVGLLCHLWGTVGLEVMFCILALTQSLAFSL